MSRPNTSESQISSKTDFNSFNDNSKHFGVIRGAECCQKTDEKLVSGISTYPVFPAIKGAIVLPTLGV